MDATEAFSLFLLLKFFEILAIILVPYHAGKAVLTWAKLEDAKNKVKCYLCGLISIAALSVSLIFLFSVVVSLYIIVMDLIK